MRNRSREQLGADRREGQQAERPPAGDAGHRQLSPLRIAALYALVAAAWILFSDRLLSALVPGGPTHLRRGVEEVRQLEAEVRATLDSIADAILVVDAEGRIANVNRAALDLLGAKTKSELLLPVPEFAERFHWRRGDGSPFPPDGFATLRALRGETLRSPCPPPRSAFAPTDRCGSRWRCCATSARSGASTS